MREKSATWIGFIAILLWAMLAVLTTASGNIPPFQLSAIAFTIGGLVGMTTWIWRPSGIAALRQPIQVWILGIAGLFGYHFAYFTALQNAPPVEAGLIAYLWPLLIVMFSALLPGEQLKIHHVFGALLGLFGAGLIVTKGQAFTIQPEYTYGYLMAFVCALTWSSYSVLSRCFAKVPSDVITGFCFASAILSLCAHLLMEETVWPSRSIEWFAILGLGLGPVGLAFYVWDYGMKHGDVQVLGAASYIAPLLSTLILIITGFAKLTWVVVAACLFITVGAVLAAKDHFVRKIEHSS